MNKLLSFSIPGPDGSPMQIQPTGGVVDPGQIGLMEIVSFGVSFLFGIAAILSLFFLLWGGLSWITSGGDAEKIDKARKTLIYAVVGLVLIIFSLIIINLIGTMLGVKLVTVPGFTPRAPEGSNNDTAQGNCPDRSGNYSCGRTSDTRCPLCSPVANCSTDVYSIASCSGSAACYSQGPQDCEGIAPGCPGGIVTCDIQPGQSQGSCRTVSCP